MQKHPYMMQTRHFAPPAFVLAQAASLSAALWWPAMWWGFLAIIGSYCLASLAVSLRIAAKTDIRYAAVLPFVFASLHFGYGLGLLVGLAKFGRRWGEA